MSSPRFQNLPNDLPPPQVGGVWPSNARLQLVVVGTAVALLAWLDRSHYLLFHSIVEMLSVALAVAIFGIGWNARAFARQNLLVVLSAASLGIAALDALHLLSYSGMGVLGGEGANVATQYWVAARLVESCSFLLGAMLVRERPIRDLPLLGGYVALTGVLIMSVLPLRVFPDCYVEGAGLTPFKIGAEIVTVAMSFAAGVMLWMRRAALPPMVVHPLLACLGMRILSGIAFTSYVDVYGVTNEVGHILRLLSLHLLYLALVQGTLREPYATLFHDLARSEAGLKRELAERRQTQQLLQYAKEAAEAANRAKSDFLANMSHEIRTPMNAIIGMTDLVLGSKLSAEQRELLSVARGASDSLLSLINDILDLSKLEAHRFEIDRVEFDLHHAVEGAVEALALQAHGKALELACDVDPSVPRMVVGDPARLRQVLLNLVGNAVKFTDEGEVVVRVRPCAGPAGAFRVTVSDSGPGIPPDVQGKLFTSFFQADTSVARTHGGTGLGLAISRQIVERMGGLLRVESEPGRGSAFHVDLRLPVVPHAPANEDATLPAELHGRRALVLDDHPATGEAVASLLRAWSLLPEVVRTASEALERLLSARGAGAPFGLAVVDLQLRNEDSVALLRVIEAEGLIDGAVIGMTTSTVVDVTATARFPEMLVTYLIKPMRRQALWNALVQSTSPRPVQVPHLANPRGRSTPPPAPSASDRQFRLLVAEDNAANRLLLTTLLERLGHSVFAVENGEDALSALERERFDAVLMDVQMPRLDGLEATRRLRCRAADDGGRIPVIGLTAYAMQGDRERCIEAGMDDYVSKPVQVASLVAALERWIAGSEAPAVDAPKQRPSGSASSEVVDIGRLLTYTEADEALAREVAEAFLETHEEQLTQLSSGLEQHDADAVERAAHSLKGAVATFGAARATSMAAQMEQLGRAGHLDEAGHEVGALLSEFRRVREALEHFVASTSRV